jgi:P27 family predicted phage terminase small subunit
MGKRGPNKLPAELKIARGTLRQHRDGHPDDMPVKKIEPDSIPTAPEGLAEFGKSIWYSVLEEYSDKGVFAEKLDLPMFEKYCFMMEEMRRLEAELKVEGYLSQGAYSEVENPKFKVYNKLFDQAFKISKEYGFTPASRQNIRITQEQIKKDILDDFNEL